MGDRHLTDRGHYKDRCWGLMESLNDRLGQDWIDQNLWRWLRAGVKPGWSLTV